MRRLFSIAGCVSGALVFGACGILEPEEQDKTPDDIRQLSRSERRRRRG